MTDYRKLPHGEERLSALGLGMGGIQNAPPDEIEQVVREAIDAGINFFDLCAGGAAVYAPFGRAIAGRREQVHFQLHFGAVYNARGEYGWSRDLDEIRRTFAWEREMLGTDDVDFGLLHCVDAQDDIDDLIKNGILDYVLQLKQQGIVRHIGFSSHTPAVAERLLDIAPVDMMMFSLNTAYDMERGDEYGIGTAGERAALLRRCEKEGVGVSVMKPFHGGQLLSDAASPFGRALTRGQCLRVSARPAGGAERRAGRAGPCRPARAAAFSGADARGNGLFRHRGLHARRGGRAVRVLRPLPALPGRDRHRSGQQILRSVACRGCHGA